MSTKPIRRRSVLLGAAAVAAVAAAYVHWASPTGITGTIPVGTYG